MVKGWAREVYDSSARQIVYVIDKNLGAMGHISDL